MWCAVTMGGMHYHDNAIIITAVIVLLNCDVCRSCCDPRPDSVYPGWAAGL